MSTATAVGLPRSGRMSQLDLGKAVALVEEVEGADYDYDICFRSMATMCVLSTQIVFANNPELFARMLDAGVCECVVNVLTKYGAMNAELAANGVTIIKNLSFGSKDLSEHFAENGACEVVVFMGEVHMGEAEVADAVAGAIGMLAKNSIGHSYLLAQAGACDVLAQIGNFGFNVRHPLSAQVASQVCYAYSQLAEASNATRLAEAGACDLVISLIRFHTDHNQTNSANNSNSGGDAESAMGSVPLKASKFSFSFLSSDNLSSLAVGGSVPGSPVPVPASETGVNNLVVSPGIKAICCLASLNYECRQAIGRAEGCELLIDCLNHLDHYCKPLAGSSGGTSGQSTPPASPMMASPMAIPSNNGKSSVFNIFSSASTIPAATPSDATLQLQQLMMDSSIAQNGCEAIMHLALCPQNADRLGQIGACQVVSTLLVPRLMYVNFGAEILTGAMLNLITYGNRAKENRAQLMAAGGTAQCKRLQMSPKASMRARENILQILEYLEGLGSSGISVGSTDSLSCSSSETGGNNSRKPSSASSSGGGLHPSISSATLNGLDRSSEVFLGVVNGSEAREGVVPLSAELREYNEHSSSSGISNSGSSHNHNNSNNNIHHHGTLISTSDRDREILLDGGDGGVSGIYEI